MSPNDAVKQSALNEMKKDMLHATVENTRGVLLIRIDTDGNIITQAAFTNPECGATLSTLADIICKDGIRAMISKSSSFV